MVMILITVSHDGASFTIVICCLAYQSASLF